MSFHDLPYRFVQTALLATSHKIGFTKATFLGYIVPPFVCQYLMAVLVQLEGTRFYRVALLPIVIWFAWRATCVDVSGGDSEQVQANSVLLTQMLSISSRSASWAFAHMQYRRHGAVADHEQDGGKETLRSGGVYSACWNAWDLLMNPRGIGWNWPQGLVLPKRNPAYTTETRAAFALRSATSIALNALAFDVCAQGIRAQASGRFGSLQGGPLFDGTFPSVFELARAVLVSILGACMVYSGLQCTHQMLAIVGVVVFRQRPAEWVPLFDAPWMSSSLGELWGRRWHQMMRDIVVSLGGRPVGRMCGRLGGVLGAFLVSGLFHDAEMRSSGRGGHSVVTVGFWVMNGVGIVLERVWTRSTGRRVGGIWGRLWVAIWLLVWGVPMVDQYAQIGRFGAMSLPGRFEPSRALLRWILTITKYEVD